MMSGRFLYGLCVAAIVLACRITTRIVTVQMVNSSIKALREVDVEVKPMASLNTLSREKLLVCHSVFGSTCWY